MIQQLNANDFTINNGTVTVKGQNKPGMLLIMANWCGHCTRFKPVYADLDSRIGKDFSITSIEEGQFSQNINLANTLKISGFPTIKVFDKNGVITGTYNEGRDLQSLLAFICKFYHTCYKK